MALELHCSQCGTEYWGPVQNAQCSECDHVFLDIEIHSALGSRSDNVIHMEDLNDRSSKKLVQQGMDKSYLQGKIIILHELINKLKAQVILLEEELEKGGFRCLEK